MHSKSKVLWPSGRRTGHAEASGLLAALVNLAKLPFGADRPSTCAIVLSVDEKRQIQALDREQPVLPMMPGIPERRTHSYVRHGTTSLFAALDIASGFVIGKCYKRHRAAEFLDFLMQIDRATPD